MLIAAFQSISCFTLAVFAIRWRIIHSPRENAYWFLLPFTIVAVVFGFILVFPYAMEVFVAFYGGALYEMQVVSYRFNGPYWWVYYLGFILPLLPTVGLFSFIGKRSILMFVIAVLALLPVLFTLMAGTIHYLLTTS